MAWYRCNSGNVGATPISLLNNCKIGMSATLVKNSPIDANNYVEVSGKTLILHRNSATPSLWLYTPYLEAGKKYALYFESSSESDGYIYLDYTTVISDTEDFPTTRIGSVYNVGGYSFTVQNSGYYAFILWRSNSNNITITNPYLIEIT